jgi:hypothetical protein
LPATSRIISASVKKPAKATSIPRKDSVRSSVVEEAAKSRAPTRSAPTFEPRSMR